MNEQEDRVTIKGIELALSCPDDFEFHWIGQQDVMDQLQAAWLVVDPKDIPLNPRLIGKPGVGKTTLAYAAARRLEKPVYIYQCTMDTRPEDLLITPVLNAGGAIRYHASPLVTAMIKGGVCILDEGNRMSEKSWASIAALLDTRRTIESIVAGLKITADPEFRLCVTMNDDASTFEVPEYIHSRLQPQIYLEFPESEEERRILKENLPFVDQAILDYVVDFLQHAHNADARYTVRDGINIARYAAKRIKSLEGKGNLEGLIRQAIAMTLGDEALMYWGNAMAYTQQKGNVYAVPVLHYTMELAAEVIAAIEEVKPDCIAVELPATMQEQCLHAASRLPDISVVVAQSGEEAPLYYLAEPCDPAFEALRSALERRIPGYCIDLDIEDYPEVWELLPDPYAIRRIGLQAYYESYRQARKNRTLEFEDVQRESYMARRLKELSLQYDRVLFVAGMAHVDGVLERMDADRFPDVEAAQRDMVVTATLTEDSCREVMGECGWFTRHYEEARDTPRFSPDRQQLIYGLYKRAGEVFAEESDLPFPGYNLRNLMHFARNYALVTSRLLPNFFQIMNCAKACVDDNYAYETWEIATEYPHLKNIDNLEELDLSPEEIWGDSRYIHFRRKEKSRKSGFQHRRRKDRSQHRFEPSTLFGICSYPPEDLVVEDFGTFLQKKGSALFAEEGAKSVPFSASLEDGIDVRETIRHWFEHTLYVKVQGRPTGGVGSVVVIFDEDEKDKKYPWRTTWLGEHDQESDMAFYATPMGSDVVGPGICRCLYGGFLMSYPPRRMDDVWTDPDYMDVRSKSEVLLAAAIDYAVKPLIVYVAERPPNALWKAYASRYNKKVVYLPLGQLSPVMLRKIRRFHVLDGHDKRNIAGDYIY